jgi:hypothetical protein
LDLMPGLRICSFPTPATSSSELISPCYWSDTEDVWVPAVLRSCGEITHQIASRWTCCQFNLYAARVHSPEMGESVSDVDPQICQRRYLGLELGDGYI